ncbi:AAA family ATPase [Duganella sp. FT92W]|uniref:AAA family ATPase n=2 Tax=Pseudoduganella rivuli TaxID=2666085 RepID=A0A7X2LSD8_9BURK|nr:AAA family ATPase [Pseudoduganella rivuli]
MTNFLNPYEGNCLIDRLRPIVSREDALKLLTQLPRMPGNVAALPIHVRVHYLIIMARELHIATEEEAKLLETEDLMIRSGYYHRQPHCQQIWSQIADEPISRRPSKPSAMAALVSGHSGTGKSCAIQNTLATYDQVILHETFPMCAHGLQQVVWLSVDVPASGKSADLAITLMHAWDALCGQDRFHSTNKGSRSNGMQLLTEWTQVATSQFLGILHLDEIQNLFKSPALARRRAKKKSDERLELSLVEDTCLKWCLNMTNAGLPLLFSGTPDGVAALTKRLATTQRFTTGGYHRFPYFEHASDINYRETFLPGLFQYQYVAKPLELSDRFAELFLELSGGVMRIMIALWVAAHRVAFERETDDLTLADFINAASTFLAPLQPAIKALRSRDPSQIANFDDMLQQDEQFWASFWTS